MKVGQDNASGKYVVLRHGNYQVSYCHLSRILVETLKKFDNLQAAIHNLKDIYAGDFLVVGLTEDDFGSLTSEQMQKFEEQFHQPQMFVRMGRSIMAIPVPDDMVKKMEEKAAKSQEKSKPAPDRDSL